jgi:AcrR family transcriptional regulator
MSYIERKIREKVSVHNAILEAARNIAVEEGWHSVTIRKIADRIEYTPPIVYEHFDNKEGLIRELILSGFRMLRKEYDKILETESDPKRIIMQFSLVHLDFAVNNTELYQLMFSLERPFHDEEIFSSLDLIKSIFIKITNNDSRLVHDIMMNWMCLMTGTITTFFQMKQIMEKDKIDPRETFIGFINRFLKSI